MYTGVLIARRQPATYKGWIFGARYEFTEWEHYCRSDPTVLKTILGKLANPKVGIAGIINSHQIPVSSLNPLVNYVVTKRFTAASCRECGKLQAFWNMRCTDGHTSTGTNVFEAGHEFFHSAPTLKSLGTAT